MVASIASADMAIVVADTASLGDLRQALANNCFIVHRLDEHFEDNEQGFRKEKHDRIRELNKLAHVTVFQSEFVRQNVLPHLRCERHTTILNGGDEKSFRPAKQAGHFIGHVSWGVGDKKRLDLVEDAIRRFPHERFLLVGNHAQSPFPFKKYSNVTLLGRLPLFLMPFVYRRMKALYFPSENDPCPNTVVEALLSGVPVAYNGKGGARELVGGCGLPIEQVEELLQNLPVFRSRCFNRPDLYFSEMAKKYLALFPGGTC